MFFSMLFASSYIESNEDWPDCSVLLCTHTHSVSLRPCSAMGHVLPWAMFCACGNFQGEKSCGRLSVLADTPDVFSHRYHRRHSLFVGGYAKA